jgi:AraC family transcriptional regulator
MEPKLVSKPSFHAIGLAGTFTSSTNDGIPGLWSRFAPQIDAIPHRRGKLTFGVCIPAEEPASGDASFTYVAGVEVERIDAVPDGMIALTVRGGRYAVFTHRGHIARIKDTFRQVFGNWLPATPHRHLPSPDFELYDDRFDPASGEGEVDIYVPIADDAEG